MAVNERGGAFSGGPSEDADIVRDGPISDEAVGGTSSGSVGGAFGSGNTAADVTLLRGPVGPEGAQGDKGDKGDTGSAGAKGDMGDTGATGAASTVPGPAGADSIVPGPQGPKGDTGDTGAKGDMGDAGADSTVPGPQGIMGDMGDAGTNGAAFTFADVTTVEGPAGVDYTATGTPGEFDAAFSLPRGATGAIGMSGPNGMDGTDGTNGMDGADSVVPGPQGMQGIPGTPAVDPAITTAGGLPVLTSGITGPEVRTLIGAGVGNVTNEPAITFTDGGTQLTFNGQTNAASVRRFLEITDEHHEIGAIINDGTGGVVFNGDADVANVKALLDINEPALEIDDQNGNLTLNPLTTQALVLDAIGAQQEIETVSLTLESDLGSGGTVAGSALQITVAKTIQAVAITRGNDADTGALNNGTLTLDLVDGGNVEANPGTPTEELDTIRIDDVNYELAAGGTLVLPNDPLVVLSSLTQLNTVTIGLEEFRLPGAPIFTPLVADVNVTTNVTLFPGDVGQIAPDIDTVRQNVRNIERPFQPGEPGTDLYTFQVEVFHTGVTGTTVLSSTVTGGAGPNGSMSLVVGDTDIFEQALTINQINNLSTDLFQFSMSNAYTYQLADGTGPILTGGLDAVATFNIVEHWYTAVLAADPAELDLSGFTSRGNFSRGVDFRFSGAGMAYVLIPGEDATYTFKSGSLFLSATELTTIEPDFQLFRINEYDGTGNLDVTIT